MRHCRLIFSREIFYVTLLSTKILLGKHELASLNLAKNLLEKHRIGVANFQVLDRSHNNRIFNDRTLKYLAQYNSLLFDPSCIS